MNIHGYPVSFSTGFENYSDDQKQLIIERLTEKYKDFNEIVVRNYNQMLVRYQESGKSKLYLLFGSGIPYIRFELQYPNIRDDGSLVMVMIMFVTGKQDKLYYNSIGKFNINYAT